MYRQILLMTIFIAIGWIEMPNDIFYMLCAWILMAFFALGLGLIICTLAHYIEPFGKIWEHSASFYFLFLVHSSLSIIYR